MRAWPLLCVLLAPSLHEPRVAQMQFIIWNVGQGSWVTHFDGQVCDHFDLGGERLPLREIQELCHNKLNRLHFTHDDWDHLNALSWIAKNLRSVCIAHAPPQIRKPWLERKLSQLSPCKKDSRVLRIHGSSQARSSNESSQIFVHQGFLIPGDAPISSENKWAARVQSLPIRHLLLGHHGSRTSTGAKLLTALPNLKHAIVSARYQRYRHPHEIVLRRLSKNKTPVLRTEHWGHLRFLL